jgi:DNA-directed RNA polymerase specialized sigma24 family protein
VSRAIQNLGGGALGEDAVSSGFRTFYRVPKVHRRPPKPGEPPQTLDDFDWGQLAGLLVRIAQNKLREEWRSRNREAPLPSDGGEAVAIPLENPPSAQTLDQLLDLLEAVEDRQLIALENILRDPKKRMVYDKSIDGLSTQQIADDLSTTGNPVKREAIKKMLQRISQRILTENDDPTAVAELAGIEQLEPHLQEITRAILETLKPHELFVLRGRLDGQTFEEIAKGLCAKKLATTWSPERVEEECGGIFASVWKVLAAEIS